MKNIIDIHPNDVYPIFKKKYGGVELFIENRRSFHFINKDENILIKVYKGDWVHERAADEGQALLITYRNSILCPQLYDIHLGGDICWIVSEYIQSPTVTPKTEFDLLSFALSANNYINQIHQMIIPQHVGHGWFPYITDSEFKSSYDFLIKILFPHPHLEIIKDRLAQRLDSLGKTNLSILHRDLKVEHFFGEVNQLLLIDWENASRAPAVVDFGNFLFNIGLYAYNNKILIHTETIESLLADISYKIPDNQYAGIHWIIAWCAISWASYRQDIHVNWAKKVSTQLLDSSIVTTPIIQYFFESFYHI